MSQHPPHHLLPHHHHPQLNVPVLSQHHHNSQHDPHPHHYSSAASYSLNNSSLPHLSRSSEGFGSALGDGSLGNQLLTYSRAQPHPFGILPGTTHNSIIPIDQSIAASSSSGDSIPSPLKSVFDLPLAKGNRKRKRRSEEYQRRPLTEGAAGGQPQTIQHGSTVHQSNDEHDESDEDDEGEDDFHEDEDEYDEISDDDETGTVPSTHPDHQDNDEEPGNRRLRVDTDPKPEVSDEPIVKPVENPVEKPPLGVNLDPNVKRRARVTASAGGTRSSSKSLVSKCRFCPKRFASQVELAEHTTYCLTSRPHGCELCGKRFKTRAGLDQHTRIHNQNRAYKCNFCEKSFIQKCHLDQHERIHTGEKPYICGICGRAFRQRSGQQQHEMTHLK